MNVSKASDRAKIQKASPSPYMKTSYSKELVIDAFDTPFRKKNVLAGVLILLLIPVVCGNYLIHIINMAAFAAIGALALNLLCGNAGLLSLGQAGFMASGAFTTAILGERFGMPAWVVLPSAGVVGAVLGFLAGLPSLRLKGMYLGLSTLAVHYLIVYALSEYQYYGGSGFGITIKTSEAGPLALGSDKVWYFILCSCVFIVALFIKNLLRSRPGRAWIAIHNRDIAAEIIGINIGFYKILAFVVSSSITAMSGSLYAYYTKVATIDEYSFAMTVSYLAMIIVGGLGSILGSLIGAFIVTCLPFLLMAVVDHLEITGAIKNYFFAVQSGFFGMIIILFLLVEPLGLTEIWRRIRTYFQLWPFKFKPLAVTKR
jgi:branched-chain amino acid transport system permease protein